MISVANAQNFDALNNETKDSPKTQSASANDCKDDPRLETDIVAIMDSSTPVNPPITVTPETYLSMDGDIIKRLAGQMVICPNNPVLKSGKPAKKIVIDFEPVWQAIQTAAAKGDMETIEKYVNGVIVKPKRTEEILTMLSPLQLDDKKKEALYKASGMQLGKYPEIIDFYSRMGGKPSDEAIVILSTTKLNDNEIEGYKEKYKKEIYNIKISYDGYSDIMPDKLKGLGIQTIK